jgi:hypothetical protein
MSFLKVTALSYSRQHYKSQQLLQALTQNGNCQQDKLKKKNPPIWSNVELHCCHASSLFVQSWFRFRGTNVTYKWKFLVIFLSLSQGRYCSVIRTMRSRRIEQRSAHEYPHLIWYRLLQQAAMMVLHPPCRIVRKVQMVNAFIITNGTKSEASLLPKKMHLSSAFLRN